MFVKIRGMSTLTHEMVVHSGYKERPMLPEYLREEFQHRLAVCVSAARSYDGTESQGDQILGVFQRFEEWLCNVCAVFPRARSTEIIQIVGAHIVRVLSYRWKDAVMGYRGTHGAYNEALCETT